jgi:hypothetical protein
MNGITLTIVIIVAVVVLALIGMQLFRTAQKRRSEALRERFGPEYDRSVREADDRKAAESELREREKRHRSYELRSFNAAERERFRHRWSAIQREFVDDPPAAVHNADALVTEMMSTRGYPVDDFDRIADDVSVEHPQVTQHYRSAREISRAQQRGESDTEQLRTAVTSYRALVNALLEDGAQDRHEHAHDRREHPQDRPDHAQDRPEHVQDRPEHAQAQPEHAQDRHERAGGEKRESQV